MVRPTVIDMNHIELQIKNGIIIHVSTKNIIVGVLTHAFVRLLNKSIVDTSVTECDEIIVEKKDKYYNNRKDKYYSNQCY